MVRVVTFRLAWNTGTLYSQTRYPNRALWPFETARTSRLFSDTVSRELLTLGPSLVRWVLSNCSESTFSAYRPRSATYGLSVALGQLPFSSGRSVHEVTSRPHLPRKLEPAFILLGGTLCTLVRGNPYHRGSSHTLINILHSRTL